jgi:type IV secretion system protein VirB10
MMAVLLSRGPDVVLNRGTTLEMVLDRPISFKAEEVDFSGVAQRTRPQAAPPPVESGNPQRSPIPSPRRIGRMWP